MLSQVLLEALNIPDAHNLFTKMLGGYTESNFANVCLHLAYMPRAFPQLLIAMQNTPTTTLPL